LARFLVIEIEENPISMFFVINFGALFITQFLARSLLLSFWRPFCVFSFLTTSLNYVILQVGYASGGSTVEEPSPHHPKVNGLSPTAVDDTGEKKGENEKG
jgi:hypothetical protein